MAVSDVNYDKKLQTAEEAIVPAPISSSFCAPDVSQFKIKRKFLFSRDGSYHVKDHEGKLLLKFFNQLFICCNQIVYDGQGVALLSLKSRIFTFHSRWDAYSMKKTQKPERMLFSMARSSALPWNTSFTIRLPGNETDKFKLSSDFWHNHFKVRHNGVVIAEADLKRKFLFLDSEISVTANAGVDRAFIASILIIQRKITKASNNGSGD